MKNYNQIEKLKRIYERFLGDKGVEYVENNYSEACENVVKFYDAMKDTLTDEEAYILDRKFGIYNRQMSFLELADELNISFNEVMQIHSSAIRKLKHPSRSRIGYAILLGEEYDSIVKEIEIPNDLSKLLIEDIPFSIRTHNVLKRGNIITLEDLVNTSVEQLKQLKFIGIKCLREIEEFLNEHNLKLKN